MLVNIMQENKNIVRKQYKTHVDKMKYIKFPVTIIEKRGVRKFVKKSKDFATVAQYVRFVIQDCLATRDLEGFLYRLGPQSNYMDTGIYLHGWLLPRDYDTVIDLSIMWDCSIRKAAHRIFMYEFLSEGGELQ